MSATRNVVIDSGSYTTRAGFAGAAEPQVVFPTLVAREQAGRGHRLGYNPEDRLVGKQVEASMRKVMSCVRPVDDGFVQHWDDIRSVWEYAITGESGLNTDCGDVNVMITEEANNPKAARERAMEIFFEDLGVNAFAMQNESMLTLLGAGARDGVVVDIGHGQCDVSPIYQRTVITHAWHKVPIGGEDLTRFLAELLRVDITCHKQRHAVRELREKYCYAAQDFEAEQARLRGGNLEIIECVLPDGHRVRLANEQYRVPEALFDPDVMGHREAAGIIETTYSSVMNCDPDLHETLLANIVLSGCVALTPGLRDRYTAGLSALLDRPVHLLESHPHHAAWVGGAILASEPNAAWVTRNEYEDEGLHIIHKRFPRTDRRDNADENPVTPSRRRALSKRIRSATPPPPMSYSYEE